MVKNAIKVFLYIFYAFLGLRIFHICWFPQSHSTFGVFLYVQKSFFGHVLFFNWRGDVFFLLWQTCASTEANESDRKEGPSFCDSVKR